MFDRSELVFCMLFAGMMALFAGLVIGDGMSTTRFQQEAALKGVAEYCSITGDWAWKGECK